MSGCAGFWSEVTNWSPKDVTTGELFTWLKAPADGTLTEMEF